MRTLITLLFILIIFNSISCATKSNPNNPNNINHEYKTYGYESTFEYKRMKRITQQVDWNLKMRKYEIHEKQK